MLISDLKPGQLFLYKDEPYLVTGIEINRYPEVSSPYSAVVIRTMKMHTLEKSLEVYILHADTNLHVPATVLWEKIYSARPGFTACK